MRFRILALALGSALVMTACGGEVSSPSAAATDSGAIDLMPDFEISSAVRDRVLNEKSSLLVVDAQQDSDFGARHSIVIQFENQVPSSS